MSQKNASTEFKTVGKSGQISLGKSYAGKTLRLERRVDGSIVLTAVAMVPESQLWTLQEPHRTAIAKGMAWAARVPAKETDLDELVRELPKRTGRKASRAGSK